MSDNPTSGQTPTHRSESSPAPQTAGSGLHCSPFIRAFTQPLTRRLLGDDREAHDGLEIFDLGLVRRPKRRLHYVRLGPERALPPPVRPVSCVVIQGPYTDPMPSSWSNNESVCSPYFFDRLLEGPSIVHIQTPREQFVTCSPEQRLSEILCSDTIPYAEYDYLPVVRSSQVIGVLGTRSAEEHDGPTVQVRDCYQPLDEHHLLGADASILKFVLQADCHPYRFVVSGERITGLVTVSDLQRLPVRMTLFALLTGFEMTLIEAIKRRFPEDEDWLSLLHPAQQIRVKRAIRRAKASDHFVHGLYATNFSHKELIVQQFACFDYGGERLKTELCEIRRLRNRIAHADNFALAPEQANKACRVARNLLALREQLCSWLRQEQSAHGAL